MYDISLFWIIVVGILNLITIMQSAIKKKPLSC